MDTSKTFIKKFFLFITPTIDEITSALHQVIKVRQEIVIGIALFTIAYAFISTSSLFRFDQLVQRALLVSGCMIVAAGIVCCLLAAWRVKPRRR
jgi:hypothetical protein